MDSKGFKTDLRDSCVNIICIDPNVINDSPLMFFRNIIQIALRVEGCFPSLKHLFHFRGGGLGEIVNVHASPLECEFS